MNGIDSITKAFTIAQNENRAALMPYFTLGYPTQEDSLEIIQSISTSGADLIELGVPFSDPLADGPTIQRSTQVSLDNGVNVSTCLEMVTELRQRGVQQPLLLMGYYNPILAYGIDRYVSQAAAVGADGFIVPDLPPQEAEELEFVCEVHDMALIYLLAPTSTPERIEYVSAHSTGFVYLVSVIGVTGARESLPVELSDFVSNVRSVTDKPLAVGFGIGTPEQARDVGKIADGVIIGSALINTADAAQDKALEVGNLVTRMRKALSEDTSREFSTV